MTRGWLVSASAALIGVLLPLLILFVDWLTLARGGWWPKWVHYLWPTSYVLVATACTKDVAAYLIIAFAVF